MELNKRNFDAVVVVEGKDDTKRLKQFFPGIETIETNGSEVSDSTLLEIKKLATTRSIIVLTDPDLNGERIRRLVTNAVPNAKQAFITRKEGRPNKKGQSLGVEHASKQVLQRALKDLHGVKKKSNLTWLQYQDLGFALLSDSRQLRIKVGIKLEIGYGNAKQFFKRLQMFGISYNTLKQVVDEVKHVENTNR